MIRLMSIDSPSRQKNEKLQLRRLDSSIRDVGLRHRRGNVDCCLIIRRWKTHGNTIPKFAIVQLLMVSLSGMYRLLSCTLLTLYYENIAEIMYCTTMFPIKFVLLHQVQSIFCSHDPTGTFRTTIRLLIVANFLLYFSLGLAFVFACTPREKIYHPLVEGTCISATSAMTASSGLNILSDLIILVLPLFGIAKLQLPLKKKLLIASVFALGILYVEHYISRFMLSLTLLQCHHCVMCSLVL